MFPTSKPSITVLEVWHKILDHHKPEDLERGFTKVISECRFFPVPADILSRIEKLNEAQAALLAESEWMKAWEAAGRDSTAILTEAGNYAVRLVGGWGALQSMGAIKQEPFLRKEFIAAHGRYNEAGKLGITNGSAAKLLADTREVKLITE